MIGPANRKRRRRRKRKKKKKKKKTALPTQFCCLLLLLTKQSKNCRLDDAKSHDNRTPPQPRLHYAGSPPGPRSHLRCLIRPFESVKCSGLFLLLPDVQCNARQGQCSTYKALAPSLVADFVQSQCGCSNKLAKPQLHAHASIPASHCQQRVAQNACGLQDDKYSRSATKTINLE